MRPSRSRCAAPSGQSHLPAQVADLCTRVRAQPRNAQEIHETLFYDEAVALAAARSRPWDSEPVTALPDGVFVAIGDGDIRLLWNGSLHRWTETGHGDALPLSAAEVDTGPGHHFGPVGCGATQRLPGVGASVAHGALTPCPPRP